MSDLTLIVALRGRIARDSRTPGIVVASDTQVTSDIKQSMQKVFQLSSLPILVGGAGSFSLSRHIVFRLEKLFLDSQKKLQREMMCKDFDTIVNSKAELCLRKIVMSHPDIIEHSRLNLVIGFSDEKDVRLYQVQSDGVPVRMDDSPGYCCVGSGYSTGGSLLIQQFYSDDLTLLQLTRLAAHTISQVSIVDPTVGNVAQIRFGFGGKVVKPKEELFKERLELRSDTMKRVWNLLENEDKEFERDFNKCVRKKSFVNL